MATVGEEIISNLKQKEYMMKEAVRAELKKVWTRKNGDVDEKMVDYCMKEISGIVQFEDGGFYYFKKPSIRTRFCFGYGQNGISSEEELESASAASNEAKTKEYFIAENMCCFDELDEVFNFDGNVYAMVSYCRGEDVKLRSLFTDDYVQKWGFPQACVIGKITESDRKVLNAELEIQKKKFEKRLETYWKRFGASKLTTWTYLVD